MSNQGFIYLFDNRRLFKVGKSVNMERRERDYITENPDNTCICSVMVENVDAAEAVILDMTKDYAHSHPKSGNSTEWRRRHPHVIDLFISFAKEHGIHKIAEWDRDKQKLLNRKANLDSTQYHTERESPAAKYWKEQCEKEQRTNEANQHWKSMYSQEQKASEEKCQELQELTDYWKERCDYLQDELAANQGTFIDNSQEIAQVTELWADEVKKNRELTAELASLKKANDFRLEIDQMVETRPFIVPIPQLPEFDHDSPAFKALIGAMGCVAVFAVAVLFRVLL